MYEKKKKNIFDSVKYMQSIRLLPLLPPQLLLFAQRIGIAVSLKRFLPREREKKKKQQETDFEHRKHPTQQTGETEKKIEQRTITLAMKIKYWII